MEEGDAEWLYAILSDPSCMKYIEPVFSWEKTEEFLKEAGLCEEPKIYALLLKEEERPVGYVIYHPYEEDAWEIGRILNAQDWNKGYAKEITAALIKDARKRGIPYLVAECVQEQKVTQHILSQYGFRLTETEALYVYVLDAGKM